MNIVRAVFALLSFVLAAMATPGGGQALPDPFGGDTFALTAAPLVEAWANVRGELTGDHAVIGACIDSTTASCAQARTMWKIISEANEQTSERAMIGHVNRAINLAIVSFEPSEWLTGLDAMTGAGDCQAYATAKYFALREAGIAANRLRLVVVHERGHAENHMVTAVYSDGWLVLDNQTMALVPDRADIRYTALFVLDEDSVRAYRTAPAS